MQIIDYQFYVREWAVACFGEEIANDKVERNHRFLEEALELVQSNGITKDECLKLIDYVYNRPIGETKQEVGGVSTTLSALCAAYNIDLQSCAKDELARVWTKIEKVRAKQKAKPKFSPLPE